MLLAVSLTVRLWKQSELLVESGGGCFFWMLSALVIYMPDIARAADRRVLLVPAAVALFLISVYVQHGVTHPQRQTAPLAADKSPFQFGPHSELLLSKDFATYLKDLKRMAETAGFRRGDPMIDLTGYYPGALFAIGARPLGAAWIVGGYPGGQSLASRTIDRVACKDLAQAWLLLEPAGVRPISLNIFKHRGVDGVKDFEIVGSLDSPMGAVPKSFRQYLLKPRSEKILSVCRDSPRSGK